MYRGKVLHPWGITVLQVKNVFLLYIPIDVWEILKHNENSDKGHSKPQGTIHNDLWKRATFQNDWSPLSSGSAIPHESLRMTRNWEDISCYSQSLTMFP